MVLKMYEIKFGKQKFEFERLPTTSNNYITIRIEPDKSIGVLAPTDIPDGELTKIVQTKTRWIIDKFQRIDEVQFGANPHEFVSGESFLYKGKLLRLKIKKSNEDEVFTDTTTIFCMTSDKGPKRICQLLEDWYKEKAKAYFAIRAARFSKKFNKKPTKIHIRNQILRWGSCTKKGELLLNWRLIMAPTSVIDYVLIHELAHLQEKNHTEKFWNIVKNAMPDYKEKKEWLRINGPGLSITSTVIK